MIKVGEWLRWYSPMVKPASGIVSVVDWKAECEICGEPYGGDLTCHQSSANSRALHLLKQGIRDVDDAEHRR